VLDADLVVADQTAGLDEPAEGPFHHPASWQHLETLQVVAAFDDLQIDLAMARQAGHFPFELPGVAAVGPDPLEPAVGFGEAWEQQARSVPVLDVGGCDLQRENEAAGVYQDVPLSPCNFLTRIKATKSGLASCANALAIEDRSSRGFFYPV
jgi:hypothetical protein